MKSQNAPRPPSDEVVVKVESTAHHALLTCGGTHHLRAGLMEDFTIFSPSHTSGSGKGLCLLAGMRHEERQRGSSRSWSSGHRLLCNLGSLKQQPTWLFFQFPRLRNSGAGQPSRSDSESLTRLQSRKWPKLQSTEGLAGAGGPVPRMTSGCWLLVLSAPPHGPSTGCLSVLRTWQPAPLEGAVSGGRASLSSHGIGLPLLRGGEGAGGGNLRTYFKMLNRLPRPATGLSIPSLVMVSWLARVSWEPPMKGRLWHTLASLLGTHLCQWVFYQVLVEWGPEDAPPWLHSS